MVNFLKSVFAESDGTGSWARVGSFIALLASLAWVSIVVHTSHAIPDLTGVCLFITSLYGVNKLHDGLTTVYGPKTEDPKVPNG